MATTEETEAQHFDLVQVRELLDGGAQLVEVLPGAGHAEEHLPASTSSSRNWTPPPPHGWTAPPGDRLHLGCEIGLAQVYDDVAGKADCSPTAADRGQHAHDGAVDVDRYGGHDRIERSRTCCRC